MNHSMPFSVLLLAMFVNNISAQTYQPDLNGDKFVNYSDFAILAANWQKTGSNLPGDIDTSGTVDYYDIFLLSEKWLHYSQIIFVDANALPGGDGASWETAFIYIQDGIAAAQSGYEIRVAEGIYRPDTNSSYPFGTSLRISTFQLPQGVAIYGGFPAGGFWEHRKPDLYQTILSGDIGTLGNRDDNCYNVVTGANDVVLDGFIISDGNATATGDSARGGGMFNEDVNNLIIANCIFRNNYAKYDGGAIYNYQSSVSFINCLFSSNLCGDDGAGVYSSNSNATLTNCAFFDNNAANRGGGIYNYQTPAQLINCLFSGNYADANGGAIYNGYKSVKMTNCTIADNSSGGNTGGIYNTYSTSVITNCIVWDSNTAIYNHSCNPHILYSDIEGCGGSGTGWNPNFGEDDGNNIDIAPSFDSEMALESTSLCIDMGKNPALPLDITTDIKGNARFNGTVDMGAFEFGNLDMNLDTDGDSLPDWWEYRFVLDPDDSNDAQTDLDEDDLPNLNEYENNCDAAFFDTDSDLLSDGWEVSYSLNPKVSDVIDVNDGNNVYADADNDGLDTLQEVIFATSPANPDSDDDDANDGAEVAHGGLPFDASDLGLPPSADEICELKLTIGDWSNSNSERYDLKVGPITHQAAKFGVVETKNYNLFRAGNRYEVRIIHRGTDPSKWWYPNADYDYIAQIEAVSLPAGVTMQIEDPDGILGTHGDSNTPNHIFDADGKVAYITLGTVVDLKIYNGKNGAEVSEADEESLGAYLLVNWDDDNNNDTPDLEESNTGTNENDLARLELSLSPAGLNVGTLELIKTGSNVKIWSSSNKQSEVTDLSWNLESETPPSVLWLEGTEASGAERDVQLELRYTYESSQALDTVKATAVMLNLGNAVYREKESGSNLGHGAIVIAYYGACTKEELCDADNYEIVHMQSAGKAYNLLTNITNNGGLDAYGCYANTSINYQDRLDIIKTTSQIHDVDYALVNVLEPDSWNDTVPGISALRCDGLIEVCYEIHNINVWGKIVSGVTHYDIKNDNYEDEHNDTRTPLNKGLIPVTQCSYGDYGSEYKGSEWNTAFNRQNLCQPIGHSGGN